MISLPTSELLFVCLLLSTVLATCVFLFLSSKSDLHGLERRVEQRLLGIDAKTAESELRFNVLESKLSDAEGKLQHIDAALERPPLAVAPSASGPSQGKRTAIIRLAQKGERSEQIAATVGMPKNEVDLLLKVHRAVSGSNLMS